MARTTWAQDAAAAHSTAGLLTSSRRAAWLLLAPQISQHQQDSHTCSRSPASPPPSPAKAQPHGRRPPAAASAAMGTHQDCRQAGAAAAPIVGACWALGDRWRCLRACSPAPEGPGVSPGECAIQGPGQRLVLLLAGHVGARRLPPLLARPSSCCSVGCRCLLILLLLVADVRSTASPAAQVL